MHNGMDSTKNCIFYQVHGNIKVQSEATRATNGPFQVHRQTEMCDFTYVRFMSGLQPLGDGKWMVISLTLACT